MDSTKVKQDQQVKLSSLTLKPIQPYLKLVPLKDYAYQQL